MLSYKLLKDHAGIMLMGDYSSLKWLHDVLHDINEYSTLIEDKEGQLMSFAFDIRKAFEQQREIIKPPKGFKELGTQFGVNILWPTLLVQQRLMRAALAFAPHSSKHQAATYALEAIIEEALLDDFGSLGTAAIQQWKAIDPTHPFILEAFYSRCAIFSSWTKIDRVSKLIGLLSSFDPMYEYFYKMRIENGEQNLVSSEEYVTWANAEFPDPRW